MARIKGRGLDVWLYGHRVAHLTEPSTYRYKLEFTDEALDVFGHGARVLSLALPFGTKPVADAKGVGGRPVAAFPKMPCPPRARSGNFPGTKSTGSSPTYRRITSPRERSRRRPWPEFRTRSSWSRARMESPSEPSDP
ncbi:HipA N-terminal domain-containing protein [Nocardia sp. AG03]|uniref:HipA N-terminal domain-containing protein n=1 Tax=Nocardia sp. AG03 TaxID=3025312 RepID=UPI00325B603C